MASGSRPPMFQDMSGGHVPRDSSAYSSGVTSQNARKIYARQLIASEVDIARQPGSLLSAYLKYSSGGPISGDSLSYFLTENGSDVGIEAADLSSAQPGVTVMKFVYPYEITKLTSSVTTMNQTLNTLKQFLAPRMYYFDSAPTVDAWVRVPGTITAPPTLPDNPPDTVSSVGHFYLTAPLPAGTEFLVSLDGAINPDHPWSNSEHLRLSLWANM